MSQILCENLELCKTPIKPDLQMAIWNSGRVRVAGYMHGLIACSAPAP
jgi:hypothetical protein